MRRSLVLIISLLIASGVAYFFASNAELPARAPIDNSQESKKFSAEVKTPNPSSSKHVAPTGPGTAPIDESNEWIARFAQSSDGKNLLTAYKAVQLCKTQERIRREDPAVQISTGTSRLRGGQVVDCKRLTAEQRRDYLTWLTKAVEQHVPGAAIEWLAAGPNGEIQDLEMRKDDPLVIAWKERTIQLLKDAALRGDIEAIGGLSGVYGSGEIVERDMTASIMYDVVIAKIQEQRDGQVSVGFRKLIEGYRREAPPEKWQRIEADAQAFFDRCCAKPKS